MIISNSEHSIPVYWAGKTHTIKPFGFLTRDDSGWEAGIEKRILEIKAGRDKTWKDLEMVDDEEFLANLEKEQAEKAKIDVVEEEDAKKVEGDELEKEKERIRKEIAANKEKSK